MNRSKVLLTVEQQLHAQLLQHALDACPELELIGEAYDLIECMTAIAFEKPDVWIHSWDEGPELSAALSHIYSLNPNLAVIRVCPNESAGYLQMRIHSLSDLLMVAARGRQLVEFA
jgi:hypothetical protein